MMKMSLKLQGWQDRHQQFPVRPFELGTGYLRRQRLASLTMGLSMGRTMSLNDLFESNAGGATLGYAAWKGREAVVKLLLDNNAAADSQDANGRMPPLCAAWNGQESGRQTS